MQTLATNVDLIDINTVLTKPSGLENDVLINDRVTALRATYRQLFKENRDLDFFHNSKIDSAYLDGQLTTRQLVGKLLASEMYRDYILLVNSNFRFVALCFERVLGRSATDAEVRSWSSLLATEGLDSFAKNLVHSDEYEAAFGEEIVPHRRSRKLSPSDQGLPALPAEASVKRYDGAGRRNPKLTWQMPSQSLLPWEGALPPKQVRLAGLLLAGLVGVGVALPIIFFVVNALGA